MKNKILKFIVGWVIGSIGVVLTCEGYNLMNNELN